MLGSGNDKTKIITHPEFGTITFRKRKGLRNVNLVIKSHDQVNVSLPYSATYDDAYRFVIEKSNWIKKIQKQLSEVKPTFFDETTQFSTRSFKLKLLQHNEKFVRRVITADGFLMIYYPQNADINSPELQNIFRRCILDALYAEAKQYLPQRIEFLARKYNFKYNKLTIKNNSSNLGSCSYRNNINLNLHIMRLSDELIDYVILHELCHTIEKNHSERFWKLLDSVTGSRARELSKQAKKINTKVI
jgi:predicted metal-dependent hydrolase